MATSTRRGSTADRELKKERIVDTLLRQAVSAIDAGDVTALESLLAKHPRLVRDRLDAPGAWLRDQVGDALDGFFQRPYLLWFVAEDPVRNGRLPGNIARVTRAILEAAEREGVDRLQEQLEYALRLVAWSWIARRCGVQSDLINVLIDAGARPGDTITHDALVNGNFGAAERLVERGARATGRNQGQAQRDEAGQEGGAAHASILPLKGSSQKDSRRSGVWLSSCAEDVKSKATAVWWPELRRIS